MNKIKLLLTIIILLLKTGNVLSVESIFNVNNIELDGKFYSNKQKSINKGFIDGFDKLIKSRLGWDVGLGFTISTPLGPVRLDYAIPSINDEVRLENGKFNFGVQYLF